MTTKLRPHDFEWEEALDSALESLRRHVLDGWELELVRSRVNNVLARGRNPATHEPSRSAASRPVGLQSGVKERVMDWQPIDTAPKDGTWLLLFVPKGVDERSYDVETAPPFTIGYWSPQDMQSANWYSVESYTEFYDYGGMTGAGTTSYQCSIVPTHWMPLPAPPAQGMPREAPRREGGSGASAPASPVRKDAPNPSPNLKGTTP